MKSEQYWHLYYRHFYSMVVPHFGERVKVGDYFGIVCGGDEDGGLTVALDTGKYLITNWKFGELIKS